MPVKPIVLYPEPILRQKAAAVVPLSQEAADIVRDLWDTLDSHVGVGIAAPQIGAGLRIIAVDATRARRPVPNHGRMALLNPEILTSEGEVSFREGCLSLPDLVARVTRHNRITVSAVLPDGQANVFTAEGYEAVIIQHEIDHLDGILFIDRVRHARDVRIRTDSK